MQFKINQLCKSPLAKVAKREAFDTNFTLSSYREFLKTLDLSVIDSSQLMSLLSFYASRQHTDVSDCN